MTLRILTFATAIALSSTLAFAQGGGGGGGGSGGGAGSGGSTGSSTSGSSTSGSSSTGSSTTGSSSIRSSGPGSVGSSIGGPSDVTTSGALDRAATEPLSRSRRDRSDTNLNPSDPRIGQNSRNARASTNRWDRHLNDRHSPIDRIRR